MGSVALRLLRRLPCGWDVPTEQRAKGLRGSMVGKAKNVQSEVVKIGDS